MFLGPQDLVKWEWGTALTSLHCLCGGEGRAPEAKDLSFSLALSPLAMGLSAMPPPSLSLTHPIRATLQSRVHVPQGNKEWPTGMWREIFSFQYMYIYMHLYLKVTKEFSSTDI